MVTKGTPSDRYRFRPSKKQLQKSYEVRLAAQFGDKAARKRLDNYNRRVKERKRKVSEESYQVDGQKFTRYGMMDFIVTQVAAGFGLPELCEVKGMPSMLQVYSWFDNHPEFARDYNRAEEVRGHILGELALKTGMNTDRENVAADKLKVEVMAKAAARTNPRYTDKQSIQINDEFSQMSVDQIKARIAAMVAANPQLAALVPSGRLASQESDLPVLSCEPLDSDHADTDLHEPVDTEPIPQDPDREFDSDL